MWPRLKQQVYEKQCLPIRLHSIVHTAQDAEGLELRCWGTPLQYRVLSGGEADVGHTADEDSVVGESTEQFPV